MTYGNTPCTELRLLTVDERPGRQSPVLPLTWSSSVEAQTAWAARWDGQHWWVALCGSLHHPTVHLCNSSCSIQMCKYTYTQTDAKFFCV